MKRWSKILSVICLVMIVTSITVDARSSKAKSSLAQANTDSPEMLALKCPKCQNQMEHGYLLDTQGYNANRTDTLWVQGPVVKQHFPNTDLETKVTKHVVAYRCTNCGFLESYAH